VQTGKVRRMPILLYGTEFWRKLVNLEMLVEEGYIHPEDLELFQYVDTPEAAWRKICAFYNFDKLGSC
jgi:predicted Rossmann-fold nucleotide-binding protein